jgi:hypothetical protein
MMLHPTQELEPPENPARFISLEIRRLHGVRGACRLRERLALRRETFLQEETSPVKRHGIMIAALLCMAIAAPAAARDCVLSGLEGTPVEIWTQGVWRPAARGPLGPDDSVLRTGSTARAEIRCDDGLTLTVGVATSVSLDTLLAPERPGLLLTLYRGVVGLVAPEPREGGAAVIGPLAIAAARSTEWLVLAEASGSTAAFVRAGRIEVTPIDVAGDPALLGPGEGRDVRPEGAGPVVTWGAARVAAAGEALGFGWR